MSWGWGWSWGDHCSMYQFMHVYREKSLQNDFQKSQKIFVLHICSRLYSLALPATN